GSAERSALSVAAANGYANDTSTSKVTVNIPPLSGDHAGQKNYAEVMVEYKQPRGFSGIFGSGALQVQARAVARGLSAPATGAGILVLNATAKAALNVTGSEDVNVKSGTVIVNSSDNQAAYLTGSGSIVTQEADITGDWGKSGSGTIQTSP